MKKETKELLKWYGSSYGKMFFGAILSGFAVTFTLDGAYSVGAQKLLLDMHKVDSEATCNVVKKLKKH